MEQNVLIFLLKRRPQKTTPTEHEAEETRVDACCDNPCLKKATPKDVMKLRKKQDLRASIPL